MAYKVGRVVCLHVGTQFYHQSASVQGLLNRVPTPVEVRLIVPHFCFVPKKLHVSY